MAGPPRGVLLCETSEGHSRREKAQEADNCFPVLKLSQNSSVQDNSDNTDQPATCISIFFLTMQQ